MNKQEFSNFAMALKTYYPRENLLPNAQAMQLWFLQLQDIPYNVAEVTLNKWVATQKWPPTIADIREQEAAIKSGVVNDWGEAWEKTQKAIRMYGAYNAEDALNSLDDITRTTVKRLGYSHLCMSENQSADRANFRIIYEQVAQREKERAQIPAALLSTIEKMPLLLSENEERRQRIEAN